VPLELPRYDVAIARDGLDLDKAIEAGEGNGYDVHRVTVLHADQLVAEQAAPRFGITALEQDTPQKMTWATLWVWCALKRMQVDVPEFPPFKRQLIQLAPIKGAQPDQPPDPELGPTGPGPDTDSV
jgi:hypothetical protein